VNDLLLNYTKYLAGRQVCRQVISVKGQFADEQFRVLLVATDIAQGDRAWLVTMRFLGHGAFLRAAFVVSK